MVFFCPVSNLRNTHLDHRQARDGDPNVTAFERIGSEMTSSGVLGVSKLPATPVARVETGSYVCSNSDTFFGIGDETERVRESDEHPVFAGVGG